MNYYEEIKNKFIDIEIQNKVKDYSKNKYTLEKYYEIGKLLIEAQGGETRAKYGDGLIKEYSKRLSSELGKKYSATNLKYMRQFYEFKKSHPVGDQLSWTHYRILLKIKDVNEINYYINKCIKNNYSKRKLEELIKLNEYKRIPKEYDNTISEKKEVKIDNSIPNPIIIKRNSNAEVVKEKVLQQFIMEDIDKFLKQMGDGFTYIGHEYPIKINDRYNYVDLLLFNYIFNCFVVIELKVVELKKEHIGQIEFYMNYIDKNIKCLNHNNTIGIIICKKYDKYYIEYSSSKKITLREFLIV